MTHSQLSTYVVRTKSGATLGKLTDVVYDMESYTIVQLVVTSGLIKTHEYRIHPQQIVSITDSTIVVDDTVAEIASADTKTSTIRSTPAMMRESE